MFRISVVLPDIIMTEDSRNICFTFLRVEQAGERLHQVWNSIVRNKFFSIKNKKQKYLSTFLEYENLLYVDK
jgi:hypothetical protein